MAKKDEKKSVLLYATHWRVLRKLSMEQRDHIFHAIFALIGEEEMPELDFVEDLVFTTIQENILDNIAKWEETRAKRAAAGAKGGRKRANNDEQSQASLSNAKQSQAMLSDGSKAKHNVNGNVNGNVNVNDNVNVNVNVNDNVLPQDDDEVIHSHEVIHNSEDVIHSGRVLSESEVISMQQKQLDVQLAERRFDDMAAMYPNKAGIEQVTTDEKIPLLDVRLIEMGRAINKHTAECDVPMTGGEWFAGGYRRYL